ncbi:FAD/NAD(P)-binding protein [Ancylobacter dichloromethanicus]|uniref:Hydroxyacylglutathione hydrolase n=1 Tax=Ancylobacter dichloromethanicus TaxID=518825 RepID=A0A9W6JF46_9HYPH|nr:FAD-dependent oxidoreductase [Ancylobacter dichloromethanicus]GLK74599.1 hydroxyacylglutathione hydrolase [Ancylobacter dichloromethanicus]
MPGKASDADLACDAQMIDTVVDTRVAIIGGGFSGATVAWHLLHRRPDLSEVVIVEPRAEIGRGLAYSATDPAHRINVPATRMSLTPDTPDHFNDWLEASGALDADPAARHEGRNFPSRAVFGRYVAQAIAAVGARVRHVRATAENIDLVDGRYLVTTAGGTRIRAEILVLAVAHAAPSAPPAVETALHGHPRYVRDPWQGGAFDSIRPTDRVLIIGTGLTMADIVASLEARGHTGEILAISRRGLRSRGHPAAQHDSSGDFVSPPIGTAGDLVRRIRAAVAQAEQAGQSWHCVLDQVRLQGSAIWNALPLAERSRLLRHLRPFWDVHRFRIAPQIEEVLDRRIAAGTLDLRAASLKAIKREGEAIHVDLHQRRGGALVHETFDAVIVATGPAHGSVFASNPALAALEAHGLARPDPLRLGIDVTLNGEVLDARGAVQPTLVVAGPLARGTIGELMGLPDVTNHAIRIAGAVERMLAAGAAEPAA